MSDANMDDYVERHAAVTEALRDIWMGLENLVSATAALTCDRLDTTPIKDAIATMLHHSVEDNS